MSQPNPLLLSIYGPGSEKVASTDGRPVETLSDLAEAFIHEAYDEQDFTKIASAHNALLQDFVEYDVAGRAAAQEEFSKVEAAAFESGDFSLIATFLDGEKIASKNRERGRDAGVAAVMGTAGAVGSVAGSNSAIRQVVRAPSTWRDSAEGLRDFTPAQRKSLRKVVVGASRLLGQGIPAAVTGGATALGTYGAMRGTRRLLKKNED